MLVLGVVGRLGEAHGRGAVAVADERGALLVLAWRREERSEPAAPSPGAAEARAGISAVRCARFTAAIVLGGNRLLPTNPVP